MMRGRAEIETSKGDRKPSSSPKIPYQVNKTTLIEKDRPSSCATRRSTGVGDIRDESDRDGMRIVIELKREAMSEVVLTSFTASRRCNPRSPPNMVALSGGRQA